LELLHQDEGGGHSSKGEKKWREPGNSGIQKTSQRKAKTKEETNQYMKLGRKRSYYTGEGTEESSGGRKGQNNLKRNDLSWRVNWRIPHGLQGRGNVAFANRKTKEKAQEGPREGKMDV